MRLAAGEPKTIEELESHHQTVPSVLLELTAAFEAGRVDDGARLIEHALALSVRWEVLTEAVRQGLEASYAEVGDSRLSAHAGT